MILNPLEKKVFFSTLGTAASIKSANTLPTLERDGAHNLPARAADLVCAATDFGDVFADVTAALARLLR